MNCFGMMNENVAKFNGLVEDDDDEAYIEWIKLDLVHLNGWMVI